MSDDFDSVDQNNDSVNSADIDSLNVVEEEVGHSVFNPMKNPNGSIKRHLSGMYQSWFLEYASYVILERAIPHFSDGLKPVQRRILHSMKRLDDSRFNKVANIVGHTMQFHPHGDASIGDALVQLGQKNFLIDCQGNWGNILTGHRAAASRYIEARLSKFALDTVFNPKTTEWKSSYDGRNKEPVTLPVKFPLLLAQGAEGIAVGLSCKILPHNFNELCDAAISFLKGEFFELFPDFQTGGYIDVSKYNDGERGGAVKVRAKIAKIDNKTLVISEIPFGENVMTLCDSIVKAGEKGKIKIRKVEDLTADKVEIRITLAPRVSSDKTIDALYAFTNCEVSISPNCCVIDNQKPRFLTVSDVLKKSVENTLALLQKELEIQKAEILDQLHFASLERIFIEERIYKDKEFEQSRNMEAACSHIDFRLTPFYSQFVREVTKDDILRLMEIKMSRILNFNKLKAEEAIAKMKRSILSIDKDLSNMTNVTINWFKLLKKRYGEGYKRLTELRNFDTIIATKVIEANEKLYINRSDGFIGTGLKKDEFVANCSKLDDVILFYKDGTYKIVRVAEKLFVGTNIIHVDIFKKNDKRTIYNVVYKDGKKGYSYIKRFAVTGLAREKEYDLTKGKPNSKVLYFTANKNGEAEVIKITLKHNPRLKKPIFEKDFSTIGIKGRQSMGNILTKNEIQRIGLKAHGVSTLGDRKIWFDRDILRLDFDGHGSYIGEFGSDDQILVILANGDYYTSEVDSNMHLESDIIRIEKHDPSKVWTAALFNASLKGYLYVKRFQIDLSTKRANLMGDDINNRLLVLTDTPKPFLNVEFAGDDSFRQPIEIDVSNFISVKGITARGKRVTTYSVGDVSEIKSEADSLPDSDNSEEKSPDEENLITDKGKEDKDNNQLSFF